MNQYSYSSYIHPNTPYSFDRNYIGSGHSVSKEGLDEWLQLKFTDLLGAGALPPGKGDGGGNAHLPNASFLSQRGWNKQNYPQANTQHQPNFTEDNWDVSKKKHQTRDIDPVWNPMVQPQPQPQPQSQQPQNLVPSYNNGVWSLPNSGFGSFNLWGSSNDGWSESSMLQQRRGFMESHNTNPDSITVGNDHSNRNDTRSTSESHNTSNNNNISRFDANKRNNDVNESSNTPMFGSGLPFFGDYFSQYHGYTQQQMNQENMRKDLHNTSNDTSNSITEIENAKNENNSDKNEDNSTESTVWKSTEHTWKSDSLHTDGTWK
jgi:hypothetical protein